MTGPLADTLTASRVQARDGTPSTSTVQAPQEESSHPRLEPVNWRSRRRTSSSNSLGSTASSCRRPFTRSSISSFFMDCFSVLHPELARDPYLAETIAYQNKSITKRLNDSAP